MAIKTNQLTIAEGLKYHISYEGNILKQLVSYMTIFLYSRTQKSHMGHFVGPILKAYSYNWAGLNRWLCLHLPATFFKTLKNSDILKERYLSIEQTDYMSSHRNI